MQCERARAFERAILQSTNTNNNSHCLDQPPGGDRAALLEQQVADGEDGHGRDACVEDRADLRKRKRVSDRGRE